jgi:hypothetical protein
MAVGTSSVAPTIGIRVTTEVVFGDGKLRNTNERVAYHEIFQLIPNILVEGQIYPGMFAP